MHRVCARWLGMTIVAAAVAISLPVTVQAQGQFRRGELTFVHGLPGDDLDTTMVDYPNSLPVDVCIGTSSPLNCVFAGVQFGSFNGPLSLAEGVYQITVSPANTSNPGSNPPVISGTIAVRPQSNQTFVAYQDVTGTPVGATFANDDSRVALTQSRFTVRHLARAGAVDFSLTSLIGLPGSAVVRVNNGQQSVPANIGAGPFVAKLTAPGAPSTNLLPPFNQVLAPVNSYQFYVVGTPANGTLQVLVQRTQLKPKLLP